MRLFKLIVIISFAFYTPIAIAGSGGMMDWLIHKYNTETGQAYRDNIEIKSTGDGLVDSYYKVIVLGDCNNGIVFGFNLT